MSRNPLGGLALALLLVGPFGCGGGSSAAPGGADASGDGSSPDVASDVPTNADADASAADGGADAPRDGADAATSVCSFAAPNPASTALPHPVAYVSGADAVTDSVTGLVWASAVSASKITQAAGAALCAARGGGWRLPTRVELMTLADYTIAPPGPAINAAFPSTPSDDFWTSSPYVDSAGSFWTLNFNSVRTNFLDATDLAYVRCVSAPSPPCAPARFVAQAGGLVEDVIAEQTWQQTLDAGSYAWADAQAYCASLGAGWRLPSLTELETIVDDAKVSPAIDGAAFPATPLAAFWTSSAYAGGAGISWSVGFYDGNDAVYSVTAKNRVRCVR